jgi:hypothetical protein
MPVNVPLVQKATSWETTMFVTNVKPDSKKWGMNASLNAKKTNSETG